MDKCQANFIIQTIELGNIFITKYLYKQLSLLQQFAPKTWCFNEDIFPNFVSSWQSQQKVKSESRKYWTSLVQRHAASNKKLLVYQ